MTWRDRAGELVSRTAPYLGKRGAEGALYTFMAGSMLAVTAATNPFDERVAGIDASAAPGEVVQVYAEARQPVGQHMLDELRQTSEEQVAYATSPGEVHRKARDLRRARRQIAAEAYLATLESEERRLREGSWSDHQRPEVERRLRELAGRRAEGEELFGLVGRAELGDAERAEQALEDWLNRYADNAVPYAGGAAYQDDALEALDPQDRGAAPWAAGADEGGESDAEAGTVWGDGSDDAFVWDDPVGKDAVEDGGLWPSAADGLAQRVPFAERNPGDPDSSESGSTAEDAADDQARPSIPRRARVVASELNVRAGPGAGYDDVLVLLQGESVQVLSDEGDGWVLVTTLPLAGSIHASQLRRDGRHGIVRPSHVKLRDAARGFTRALLTAGTRVQVEAIDARGWATVRLGALTGYVNERFLTD